MLVAQEVYRDDYWMSQLIARNSSAISQYHMPAPNHPHCYEITAFIAMVDQYRAFGNETYLEAATGAWEMLHGSFEHVRIPKHVG